MPTFVRHDRLSSAKLPEERLSGRRRRGRASARGRGLHPPPEGLAANAGYKTPFGQMPEAPRGSVDAAPYKLVVLSLLFRKYISLAPFRRTLRSSRLADTGLVGSRKRPERPNAHLYAPARVRRVARPRTRQNPQAPAPAGQRLESPAVPATSDGSRGAARPPQGRASAPSTPRASHCAASGATYRAPAPRMSENWTALYWIPPMTPSHSRHSARPAGSQLSHSLLRVTESARG